jgi:hypothetical protein
VCDGEVREDTTAFDGPRFEGEGVERVEGELERIECGSVTAENPII